MSIKKLVLLSLFFYAVDMACAVLGFLYGFGLRVENWWAIVGFMVLSRWLIYTMRTLVDEVKKIKKEEQEQPQPIVSHERPINSGRHG